MYRGKQIKLKEKELTMKANTYKVKRSWTNSFAQNCFELEDGTTIYIDYDQENITVESK